ncbi:purine and uridine phosphorylase [Xylaria palmicola]|nr:purine and uridine phosphorylase [Xylaria palmicola]
MSNITYHGHGPQNFVIGDGHQTVQNGSGTQNNYYGPVDGTSIQPQGDGNGRLQSNRARPPSREGFHIGLICTLPLEYDAVALQMDEFWDEEGEQYGRARGDTNTYTTGRIGNHNVVLALLPNMGNVAAAGTAANFRSSYSRLEIAFLVGICGGVPGIGSTNEALLGDVVISKTVLPYDFGRQFPSGFVPKDTVDDIPGRANRNIRSLVVTLETRFERRRLEKRTGQYLQDLQGAAAREGDQHTYRYPGVAEDKLLPADYHHKHRAPQMCDICGGEKNEHCAKAARASCAELNCDESQLVSRQRLELKKCQTPDEAQRPAIFVGRVASGDTVMKSGEHRDQIAEQHGLIAFEMKGAGAWDEVPCIIIKGICDYADSHKNKKWQPFAAATAASAMKAILERYAVTDAGTGGRG